ncbi:uncharacterized protein LOC123698113 [Colias croceus]|uniref:uncharacterized protein LOC123698113 n=1 Tax=Colias crocea TaxID=72248 RepID=UPI001E27B1AC|nr:uncharacterized protein LOC123698113 [Colias croceus]
MAQRLWLLVEWVDERNVFSNYGVVNAASLITEDNDLHTGKIVLVRDRHNGITRRGQVLRISDTKRYVKELKVMLERQDNQVKNVLSLCMNTIKEMKTGTLYNMGGNHSSQMNSSSHVLQGNNIDSSDSETDPEGNSELNFTQSSIKFNSAQNRAESFMNNPLIRTLHEKSLNRRSLASSTPLPPRHTNEITKLTFDQATQTDAVPPPAEKIAELEGVIKTLYKQFLNLTNNLENLDAQSLSTVRTSEERFSEVELPQGDASTSEVHNASSSKTDEGRRSLTGIKVRRASAQTTNTSCNDLLSVENTVDMVPIGSGKVTVPARLLKEIDWTSHTSATRQLLQAVFPRKVLATHSLTGKQSPAFADKPAKKCLDPNMVDDIVNTVSERCNVPKRIVRGCITTKCTDEAKLYRNRLMFKNSRQHQNQENQPPSPGSSNECANARE